MGKRITKGWYFNTATDKFEFGVYNSNGDIYSPFDEDGIKLPGIAGADFFVDVNAGTTGATGKSWSTAVKTLAAAIVLSNASIVAGASGWAARNRIFYKGDNNEAHAESLATLPNKCDVIGVGSYDHRPYPLMIGNHVIGAGSYMGTRFINMGFQSLATGGVIFAVPTTTSGLKFIHCFIDASSTIVATKGLVAVGVEQFEVIDCKFIGKFSTSSIEIGTGEANGLRIEDNEIQSGAIGIVVNAGTTFSLRDGFILNNTIDAQTLVIDDNSHKVIIGGNRGVTAAANTLALILDYLPALAYDNIITDATVTAIYPALGTAAT